MAEATLRIRVDGLQESVRALDRLRAAARATAVAVGAESRRSSAVATRATQAQVQAQLALEARATQAKLRALAARERAERETATTVAGMQARATRIAAAEGAARVRGTQTETARVRQLAAAMYAGRIAQERQLTAAVTREARARAAAEAAAQPRDRRGRFAGGGGGGGGLSAGRVLGFLGGAASGGAQVAERGASAQEEFAPIDTRLRQTLFQTTTDNAEIERTRDQLVAFAHARNLDFATIAEAADAAQTAFAALGDRADDAATRARKVQAFLLNVGEARDLGQDPVQAARLAGALSQSGLAPAAQQQTMRTIAGITMRGGVEMGELTDQGLQGMVGAVQAATVGARPEDVSGIVQRTVQEHVAALEVLDPRGISVTRAGHGINAINTTLRNDRTQQSVLAHIRNRFGRGSAQEQQLFERDREGRAHLRAQYQDAYGFGEAVSGMVGNDPAALANLLGTEQGRDGHVIRQALTEPQRAALVGLAGTNAQGRTGYEQVRAIQAGAALTSRDVEQGRQLFDASPAAAALRERQRALLDTLQSGAVTQHGRNRQRFETEHPWLNQGLGLVPGVGEVIKQSVVGSMTAGDVAAGTARPVLGPLPETHRSAQGLPVDLSNASIERLAAALRGAPIQATVSAHDAAHAASERHQANGPRRP